MKYRLMSMADVFVLGPETNRTMKHAVLPPAQGTVLEPRISIVVRHIATTMTAEQLPERLGWRSQSTPGTYQ
jgi:hypothetical protein